MQEFNEGDVMLTPDPEKQEDMTTEALVDPMDQEQTWPTEDELKDADQEAKTKRSKDRFAYRGGWIDEEQVADDFLNEHDEEKETKKELEDLDALVNAKNPNNTKNRVTFGENQVKEFNMGDHMNDTPYNQLSEDKMDEFDEDMTPEKMQEDLARFRDRVSHSEFPDEVDTPIDQPARDRFNKYRGLQSLRTSAWDVNEDLPYDYGRIFRFKNFAHTRRRILKYKATADALVPSGTYACLVLKGVPKKVVENHRQDSQPIICTQLLPNEQKMSVMNILIKPSVHCQKTIKSKDLLTFQVGFRKFKARAIFSEHRRAADKYRALINEKNTCEFCSFLGFLQFLRFSRLLRFHQCPFIACYDSCQPSKTSKTPPA